jgi:hypothetical protein
MVNQPLIAIDQLINCCIYIAGDGWGWADETISARLFRCHLQDLISGRWHRAVDALWFWDADHCFKSWRSEIHRRHLPSYYLITETDTHG